MQILLSFLSWSFGILGEYGSVCDVLEVNEVVLENFV